MSHYYTKIQPVLKNITAELQIVDIPGEFLTIDETICAFWSCLHFSDYMKGKPLKYAVVF
jgi:hypothetical protein